MSFEQQFRLFLCRRDDDALIAQLRNRRLCVRCRDKVFDSFRDCIQFFVWLVDETHDLSIIIFLVSFYYFVFFIANMQILRSIVHNRVFSVYSTSTSRLSNCLFTLFWSELSWSVTYFCSWCEILHCLLDTFQQWLDIFVYTLSLALCFR